MTDTQKSIYKNQCKRHDKPCHKLYVTPGRLLRSLKPHTQWPRPTLTDDETYSYLVKGEVVYKAICKYYLSYLQGGSDVHMRFGHQIAYCPPSAKNCECATFSSGAWTEQEATMCLSLLPRDCDLKTLRSLPIKVLCETYVWIARVLFPTRMRARALKVLLSFGFNEPENVRVNPRLTAHALLGQLCLVYRKVYKVDLVTRRTERSDYYLKMWSLCSSVVSWTVENEYVSAPAASPAKYLLAPCVPGSGLSFFSTEWRRPCTRPEYKGLREDRVKFCKITSEDFQYCYQMMNVPSIICSGD